MPEWARVMTLFVTLTAWLAVVIAYLVKGQLPDAILMGVPAALILALAPVSITRRRARRTRPAVDSTPAEEESI